MPLSVAQCAFFLLMYDIVQLLFFNQVITKKLCSIVGRMVRCTQLPSNKDVCVLLLR